MTNNTEKENSDIENENTFTFSDMFKFFKKLAPFIFVSVLIFLVIGMSVFYVFTSAQKKVNSIICTVIELTYPNADKGLLPDGSVLNVRDLIDLDKIQKSQKDVKSLTTASQIKENIKIAPYYNENTQNLLNQITIENSSLKTEEIFKLLLNSNIYPTQYVIEFDFRKIGMLESDAKIIMENLTNLVKAEVLRKTNVTPTFSSSNYTKENFQKYDYLESIALLSNQIYYINNYFNETKASANLNSYTGFEKYNLESFSINNMLASYESSLILNGLAKNVESTIYLLENEKNELESKKFILDKQILSLENRIKDYELKMVILNDKGEAINGTYFIEAFEQMNKDLSTSSLSSANTEERISTLSLNIDKYSKIDTNNEQNSALLEKAQEQFNDIISAIFNYSINLEIETEKLNNSYSSFVQVTLPASLISNVESPNYILSAVICLLLGIVVGVLAYYVYNAIIKRAKTPKKHSIKN